MGFLTHLFGGRLETKAVAAEATTRGGIARAAGGSRSFYAPGVGMGSPGGMDIDRAITNAYEKVVYVFKCVDTIAQKQADVPILLRANRDRDNGEVVDDKRIHDILNVRANPYETSWAFRYRLSSQLLLSRRGAFIEVINGRDGRPSQLHLLPAGRTEPIPDPENFVSGYQVRRQSGEVEVVEPERVIWVKGKPHPTDPYLQMTPLVAAGLASDTDVLARQFNYNFLANDGRPGMLITLDGLADDDDVEEIKRRFSGGPQGAGRTTVVEGTGMSVQDLSGSPRDSQWLETIKGAKDDILLAFGVPESIMGNASERTFSNADAEYENFWVHTEVPHCNSIATAFDPLLSGLPSETICAYDYDTVDVLQAAKAAKREEWRDEFQMGLRTADSYFELTGQKVWDVPATRVLHMGGFVVAPDEDTQDLMDNRFVGELPNVDLALPGMEAPRQITENGEGVHGRAQNVLARVQNDTMANRALRLANRLTARSTAPSPTPDEDIVDAELVDESDVGFAGGGTKGKAHVTPDEYYDLVGFISGALESWHGQQTKVYTDRLNHVKFRKGTRFWTDDDGNPLPEEKAVHVVAGEYIVNTDEWAESIVDTLRPRLRKAAKRRARASALDMGRMGVLDRMQVPTSGTPIQRMFPTEAELESFIEQHIAKAEEVIRKAAQNQGARVARAVEDLYRDGGTLKDIDKMIRSYIGARSDWRKNMSEQLTTTVLEGVQEEVWRAGGPYVAKMWHSNHDDRVRFDHSTADKQVVMVYESFLVGGEQLMYPGDPQGSPGNVINCRCWLEYFYRETPLLE